jgi:mannosyltransferase
MGRRVVSWVGGHRALLAVVLLGALLRLWGLGRQSLWYDEWLTTEATAGGLGDLFRHVADREGIPPPYFLAMWAWVRSFGDGEVALRSVSALAGIATIPLAYAVVRELLPQRGHPPAVVAALLVAVNPMLVWYSQEARPYSLLAALGAASLLAWARLWRRGRRSDLVAWALVCAATVAVHYFAAFLVAAEAMMLLPRTLDSGGRISANFVQSSEGRGRSPRDLLLALVPSAVVLALLAPVALRQHSHEANRLWISGFPLSHRLSEAARAAFVGPSPPNGRLWLAGVAVAAVAVLLLVARAGRDERATAALVAGIGGGAVVLPLVATAVGVDVMLSRYLIAALVPFVVAAAIALTVPRAHVVGLTAVGVLVAVSLVTVVAVGREPDLQRAEWRQVADVAGRGEGDRVLVLNLHGGMGSPLRHYLDGAHPLDDGDAVRIEAVDVVVAQPSDVPCNLLVGRGCAMIFLGAPPPEALMTGGLTLDRRVALDQFRIDRYRFPRPTRITRDELLAPADRPNALVLLIREPARG